MVHIFVFLQVITAIWVSPTTQTIPAPLVTTAWPELLTPTSTLVLRESLIIRPEQWQRLTALNAHVSTTYRTTEK